MFVPVFLCIAGAGIHMAAERYIESMSQNLAARVGTLVGRMTSLVTADIAANDPALASRLFSTMMSDAAITCSDVIIDGAAVKALAQPRNLGCTKLVPEKIVTATMLSMQGATLKVGFSEAEIRLLEDDTKQFGLFAALAALVVAGLAGVLAFGISVGRPIRRLLTAMRNAGTTGDTHVAVTSQDEIGRLCLEYNAMQDRIEAGIARTAMVLDDLKNAYNTTPGLLFTIDDEGILSSASDYWVAETGYDLDHIIGSPLTSLLCPQSRHRFSASVLEQLHRSGSVRDVPLSFWRRGGDTIEVLLSAIRDTRSTSQRRMFVCLMTDVTLLRLAQDDLRAQALTDQLTKLPNRRGNGELLDAFDAKHSDDHGGHAVLFVDLDNFKTINDTHGHEAGDEVIRVVAKRLSAVIGEQGSVSRLGGDEFCVLADKLADRKSAEVLARQIIATVSKPIQLHSGIGHVGSSIGIAYNKGPAVSGREALRDADQAMYLAKEAGRNTFRFFDEADVGAVRSTAEMVQLITSGMAKNWFEIHYQPIVDLNDMQTYALEALLRVKPEAQLGGSIENLIQNAERTGQMGALGNWIFGEAVEQFVSMTGANPMLDVSLSINLSTCQLNEAFVQLVKQTIVRHPVLSGRLILEITETAAMSQIDLVHDLLSDLRDAGTRIALDDFGTGYSSLSYINRLPVDIIKLDKSFIDGCDGQMHDNAARSRNCSLLKSIVALARELDLQLVGEGVETVEVVEELKKMGVRLIQGHVFSAALDVRAADHWISQFGRTTSKRRGTKPALSLVS
jgi:diguanylate cyclase (GGDEF)-like protein/PAS domain S-box-containing protein